MARSRPLLTRRFQPELELRDGARVIAGIAVPYDSVTDLGHGQRELFRRGSFARTISERGDRVKFLANHEHGSFPIGRATLLREDAAGLYAEFRVSQTAAGDEALELVRDGTVDGLSVGFRVVDESFPEPDLREIREAALVEVSLTAFPAYDDARVLSVRAAHQLLTGAVTGRRSLSLARRQREALFA